MINFAELDGPVQIVDVYEKKKRSQDRALGYPMPDVVCFRVEAQDRHKLRPVGEV